MLATQSPERSPLNIGVDVRKRSAERIDAHRAEENAAWDAHKIHNDPEDWV